MKYSRKHRSRKSHSRKHRKSHSRKHRSRKSQKGGACSALPMNREAFQQRGGMAPFVAGDAYLLDAASRVQAEVAPLDTKFAELPSVIPKQMGGRRRRTSKRHTNKRRSSKRRTNKRRSSRRQRGGALQAFDAPYTYMAPNTDAGMNPQFRTEALVNSLYNESKGAQGV